MVKNVIAKITVRTTNASSLSSKSPLICSKLDTNFYCSSSTYNTPNSFPSTQFNTNNKMDYDDYIHFHHPICFFVWNEVCLQTPHNEHPPTQPLQYHTLYWIADMLRIKTLNGLKLKAEFMFQLPKTTKFWNQLPPQWRKFMMSISIL